MRLSKWDVLLTSMSDEDIASQLVQHGGWVATVVAGIGLWILKKLFSAQLETLMREFQEMRHDIADLREDMAAVKTVIRERSPNGRYTWPRDSR